MRRAWAIALAATIALGVTPPARASSADAWAVALAAGGIIGAGAAGGAGAAFRKLDDWIQPGMNDSRLLGAACGLSYDAVLGQNNAFTFLVLAVKNRGGAEKSLDPQRVRLRFDPGAERLPSIPWRAERQWLKPEELRGIVLPLPSKDDLLGAKTLEVSFDVRSEGSSDAPCVAKVVFHRSAPAADVESESVTSSVLSIGGGFTLDRAGDMATLGTNSGSVALELHGYMRPKHGMFLALYIEGFGGGDRDVLAPATGGVDPELSLVNVVTGYSHRRHLSDRFHVTLDLGLGLGLYNYTKDSESERQDKSAFILTQGFNLNYAFARARSGFWRGDYMIGAGLYHTWVSDERLSGIPLGGRSLSLLLMFRLGS